MKIKDIIKENATAIKTIDGRNYISVNALGNPISDRDSGIVNFWKWFGNSETVDKYGRPMVFYHGSPAEFSSFDTKYNKTAVGIYFSPDYDGADFYSESQTDKGSVYECYLRCLKLADFDDIEVFNDLADEAIHDQDIIRDQEKLKVFMRWLIQRLIQQNIAIDFLNLYVADDLNADGLSSITEYDEDTAIYLVIDSIWEGDDATGYVEEFVTELDEVLHRDFRKPENYVRVMLDKSAPAFSRAKEEAYNSLGTDDWYNEGYQDDFVSAAIRKGYDSIVMLDTSSHGEGVSYVVIDPNQIKSVKNNGSFSVSSDNIYK